MRKLRKSCNHKRNINIMYNQKLHCNCLQQLPTLRSADGGAQCPHKKKKETSVLREALKTLGIKNNPEGFVEVVHAAADPIHASQFAEIHSKNRLQKQHERYCTDNPNGPKLTVAKFDDYLYRWAMKVQPVALDIVFKRTAFSPETQIYFVIMTFEDIRCF